MTMVEKTHLLYKLYKYRALGHEYVSYHRKTTNAPDYSQNHDSLDALLKTVNKCQLCGLSKCRKKSVFGEGDPNAKLMFIAEAPGASEDELGKPFVGLSGQLLTKIIENVLKIKRNEVFITNIVKCHPPKNRPPTSVEIEACKPFLIEQISLIQPQIIITLGATSYHHLTGEHDTKISQIRGSVIPFNGMKLIPTYHPSFLLRNPSAKKDVYQDMLKVKTFL